MFAIVKMLNLNNRFLTFFSLLYNNDILFYFYFDYFITFQLFLSCHKYNFIFFVLGGRLFRPSGLF